jgi:hypothetical protein
MLFRIGLGIGVVVIAMWADFGSAGESAKAPPAGEVAIEVKVRQLNVPEDLLAAIKTRHNWAPPALSQSQVIGQRESQLLHLVANPRRGNVDLRPKVRLPIGQKVSAAIRLPGTSETLQATTSKDGQAVQLSLAFPKNGDGTFRLPDVKASVPVGSHLLIHVFQHCGRESSTSYVGQLAERFNVKPVKLSYQAGFVLLTPRIVAQEGPEEKGEH